MVVHLRRRLTGGSNNPGLDKFVILTGVVSRGDGGGAIGSDLPLALNQRPPSPLDPLPAIVAVHGIIAADDRGDPPAAEPGHLRLQLRKILRGAARRCIATVEKGVNQDLFDALRPGHFEQSIKMGIV